ncbi:GNAT family N-acetyltransferase [Sphaerobacter thermophilus]|jgi:predicted GNAT family N-acyltransferase|uniref:GNAT family N-acetyltransferase n=1 Tax=Sphaerobacter thermophilus TaxID=2057 RepID=UPI0001A353F1|nr:GNAT family N-acetyltransferase [Sphaerobacter thermophilus]PZN68205.1 MAG: GNAT family N-acetyltransferase [Sphaerobacter thermophilus]
MTALKGDQETGIRDDEVRTWVVTSLAEMAEVYAIRHEVFVEEQHLTRSVRDDPDDRYSVHVLGAVGGQTAGTGRITFYGDEAQIVWVAVRKPYRGRGVGRAIMEHLLRLARDQGSRIVTLNAQTHALTFYEALGFRPIGRRFFMSNIEHQYMAKEM